MTESLPGRLATHTQSIRRTIHPPARPHLLLHRLASCTRIPNRLFHLSNLNRETQPSTVMSCCTPTINAQKLRPYAPS